MHLSDLALAVIMESCLVAVTGLLFAGALALFREGETAAGTIFLLTGLWMLHILYLTNV